MSDSTWLTDDDDGYDVSKFYTRSEKTTRQVRAHLTLDAIAEIERLVQGKDVAEIRTIQDFLRDAVHHRLHWVLKEKVQTPESAQRLKVMQLRADAEATAADVEQNRLMLDAIRHSLSELQGSGNKAELRKHLARLEVTAEGLDEPWNWQLLEVLENYRAEVAG